MMELSAVLQTIKAANDIIKGIIKINTETAVKEKAIELQSIIILLQEQITACHSFQNRLLEEKRDLEKKLIDMENWEIKKQNYILKEIDFGTFAYVTKDNVESANSNCWFCANCMDQNHTESVYQNRVRGEIRSFIYYCPNCNNEIYIENKDYCEIPQDNVNSVW
ncbi:MAG: hypothetical protein HYS24_15070 [Ignavibacteriales bacterium]|nr:hypothetical protein [Ignavibacteriales bacterium]